MKYRIVVATEYWHDSNYIIQERHWWWPFWSQATSECYETIEEAKNEIERLKEIIEV